MLKVSIVTISFNQSEFLECAIRSVVTQNCPELEYIVVDPGSSDGSREIIHRYSNRIAKTIFEPDSGAADGLNRGFAYATGDIFGYINADDAYLPGSVAEAARIFEEQQDVDVVVGNGYRINAQGRAVRRVISTPFDLRGYAFGSVVALQQSTFFRSSAFRAANGFNVQNHTCWDGELLVDMAFKGSKFKYVPRYWSAFRVHDDSISGSGRLSEVYLQDQQRLTKRILGYDPPASDVISRVAGKTKKWIRQPEIPLLRIMDKFIRPRMVVA